MAVDDPVVLVFDDRYAEPWALLRGGETFYDRDNPDPKQRDLMRRWQSPRAAIAWARDNLGVEVVLNEELVKMNDDLIAAYDE